MQMAVKQISRSILDFVSRIGDKPALKGQPAVANIPGVGPVSVGGSSEIEAVARQVSEKTGIPYYQILDYVQPNQKFATSVADEYSRMLHNPSNPDVKQAYDALASETMNQYEAMLSAGVKPYFIRGSDPYQNSPYEALLDLQQNKRLGVFPTRSGFGTDEAFDPSGNPLLADTGLKLDGEPLLVNDAFRAVHDYFGHGKGGFGFRAAGEENAYRAHSGMFSDAARRAAASETRGQNSWLNFGPFGKTNRTANIDETVFADQKTGLLPNWAIMQGTPIADARREDFFRIANSLREGDRIAPIVGALTPEGNLRLVHYGRESYERTDPTLYGKGLSGRTREEASRASDPDFVQRTYFGIEGTDRPYKPEFGLSGRQMTQTEIPIEQVYDLAGDPANLFKELNKKALSPADRATQQEKILRDKGYSGYFVRHPRLGDVASIFDPLRKGFTHTVRIVAPVASGGILGALGMPDQATAGSIDSIVPGGLTAPSMADVRSAMEQSGSGSQDVQQFILDALLGFAAPQQLGDATMTGRAR